MDVLRDKAQEYVDAGLIDVTKADSMIRAIEAQRGAEVLVNDTMDGPEAESYAGVEDRPLAKLNAEQLSVLLNRREQEMRQGATSAGETDQWRVYSHIVSSIRDGRYLRLMVQASAGTGKSFLLTTVFLWCLVHKKTCKAACPTGIAASNIEIDGTDVRACTLHSMFELETDNSEARSKLDFSKASAEKVCCLIRLQVLLLDEARLRRATCALAPRMFARACVRASACSCMPVRVCALRLFW